MDSIVKIIRGLVKIKGDSDGSKIGNVSDALKVYVSNTDADPVVQQFSTGQLDPFARQRVSEPIAVFAADHRFPHYTGRLFNEKTIGGATISHDSNRVSQKLECGTAINDEAIYQTRRYIQYYKGKSQYINYTGSFVSFQAGVRKRFGYFDDENGIFFEMNGTSVRIGVRSKVSGSVVDTYIEQASWNLDKLDGTGFSELDIDFTNQILFIFDFAWLGSGSIRMGIVYNDRIYYAHRYAVSGLYADPWSQSGTLPLRAEIKNITAQASSNHMFVTCMSVASEGGVIDESTIYGTDSGVTDITVTTTKEIILGARINPLYNRASSKLLNATITAPTGNKEIYWEMFFNPTIVDPLWDDHDHGIMQTLSSYTSFSGGIKIAGGYVEVGGRTVVDLVHNDVYWGRDIDGNSDTIIITARTLSSTAKALVSGEWKEYT